MKHRYTKERKRDREEFVYRHRDLIGQLKQRRDKLATLSKSEDGLKLVRLARSELGYNLKTNDVDIILSLYRAFYNIIPTQ